MPLRLSRCREVCKSWDQFIRAEITESPNQQVRERLRRNQEEYLEFLGYYLLIRILLNVYHLVLNHY